MKTSSTTRFRFLVLLACTVAFAIDSANAQSYLDRMRMGGGCPFCNPRGQQNYGDPSDNFSSPDTVRLDSTPVTPPATAPTRPAAVEAAKLAAETPDQPLKRNLDGSWNVSFGQLASYHLEAPVQGTVAKPGSVERIPEPLRQLDGAARAPERVHVAGQGRGRTDKAAGKGATMQMDTPLQFSGILHVGEIYEDNFFVGVYRLDAGKVSVN